MVVAGALFWITSITMHKFIMKHPQIKDICKHIFQLGETMSLAQGLPETDNL